VDGGSFEGLPKIVAASLTKLAPRQICFPACGAGDLQLAAALITEASVLLVLKPAFRAFHSVPFREEDRQAWPCMLELRIVLKFRKSA
jgi:hypothetical protein